jgi:hypothetical protein
MTIEEQLLLRIADAQSEARANAKRQGLRGNAVFDAELRAAERVIIDHLAEIERETGKPQPAKVIDFAERKAALAAKPKPRRKHEWGPSFVNHGEAQCIHCLCTNREAAYAIGPYCPED